MNTLSRLNALLEFARQHSDFYRKHFHNVARVVTQPSELPLIDAQDYWHASEDLDHWPVLTAPIQSALIFKTGGTTSAGKLSVVSHEEWQTLVSDYGGHLTEQLNPGDRIANLFFVGDLYASFIFIHDALAHVQTDITRFPFTGNVDSRVLADSIENYRINVLVGIPAQMLTFAGWLEGQSRTLDGITTLLYGGESLFAGQLQVLRRVFPNARVASIGYGSVEAGIIGVCDRDCALGEHRTLERHNLLEIIDEQTGEVIDECHRTGRLVTTNFTRRLMPLIRYPVGDLGCWREPAGTPMRKFALMGRSMNSQCVRVSLLSLQIDDIGTIVQRVTASEDWQMLIDHAQNQDILILKWVNDTLIADTAQATARLRVALLERYPLIESLIAGRQLDLQVVCCRAEALSRHPRSGKRRRVLDLRIYDSPAAELP
ncbi:AMP-binding protein [Pseudomonas fluorescens]|uniref:AMP-dependent synthetase n=1 Tax=Pseudomonas fluorescens TaxID=294 RepID=A0A423LNG4_PSEFL|nr:AMP-binding protein [Pseudomonas fluorescens]RON69869.1 AMP-dependent synthetase [Pseudomonas fluorescens]